MFGKTKSSADKFIMARGRAAGNLPKASKAVPASSGKKVAAPKPAERKPSGRHVMGAMGHVKHAVR